MKTAIKMAHALGSRVIVEGVETLEEVTIAEKAGADALQGFYFSKSLPKEDLTRWLDQLEQSPQKASLEQLEHAMAS